MLPRMASIAAVSAYEGFSAEGVGVPSRTAKAATVWGDGRTVEQDLSNVKGGFHLNQR
ncbi:hypothetical protein [Tunturiibacter gelidoferens]|uniref:Uncharacterized protein n=3 Tax=Tunturiibacter TaxID=3154218 RepID=A0A7Y9NQP1_9BACT|nr:hypothetical protein [Edaphobacter lichenicola]MBB5341200.1 hypothetical protein [Edaphobacter lichenicola]NYF53791.1 hypothetical protein [Edaphobacter lichenicola]